MPTVQNSRARRRHLAAVAGTLVLAACGGSSSGGSASPPTTGAPVGASTDGTAPTTASETAPTNGSASTSTTDADQTTIAAAGAERYLGDYTVENAEFGTQVTVSVAGPTRTMRTNALPDHETGEFPNDNNPNTISAQDLTWSFPTAPTWTGDETAARVTGVAVNGIKFEPGTAESVTCDSGERYRVEAIEDTFDLGLDFNNAHVQPTGEYHYHGIAELLVDAQDSTDDLVLIGFAGDGYGIYYSTSGAYASGYSLTDTARSGTGCVYSIKNQSVADLEGTAADGTYTSDWEWSADDGDLDRCNGVEIDGQYAYLITDTYPFIGRCLNGEFDEAQYGGGPPPGSGAPGGPPPGPPGGGSGLPQGPPPGGSVPPTQG